jgi:3-methyladenine DNA glycosylase AlkD
VAEMANKIHNEFHKETLAHINNISGSVPVHRNASKHVYSFSKKSFEEQLAAWDYTWHNSNNFWVRLHATFFLERHMKDAKALKMMWPVIMKWQDDVTDWPLCDSLAKIYTKILVVEPTRVFATLKKWNSDADLWKRRQSLVSLLYYSRTKKEYLPFGKMEPLIASLLKDKEYYVQKGVGWALRELHTVYPAQTLSFLKSNIKLVSSIAFTIAMEKMDTATKDSLKLRRRAKP